MAEMATGSQDSPTIFRFEAEMRAPNKLIPMLNAIQIMKTSVLTITRMGLRFSCQDTGGCLQANCFIDRSLFRNYFMSKEETPVSVCLQLPDFLSLLSVLGVSCEQSTSGGILSSDEPSLKLSFESSLNKLFLTFRENGVLGLVTEAEVTTFGNGEQLILYPTDFCNKVIVNAKPILQFWRCADLSSEFIQVSIYGREPYLQLSTKSERARVDHNIHRDDEAVQQFICTYDVSNKYKMCLMKETMKALLNSIKLSIRMNREGLLSIQFMIKDNMNDNCFIEYYVLPEAVFDL